MTKTYTELINLKNFEDRFNYLKLDGKIGETTFSGHRYLNQLLYHSDKWKRVKREVILRDNGCDLACEDYPILGNVYIHHINPITIEDINKQRYCIFDLENLVCVSFRTHNAIHYGDEGILPSVYIERRKNDTCLWR